MRIQEKKVIAVDLDQTLIFEKDGELYPVDGAVEAMKELRRRGIHIVIHTCRIGLAERAGQLDQEIEFLIKLLEKLGIEYDEIFLGEKLVAHAYIDDRAIQFDGSWEDTLHRVNDFLTE